jgi:phage gp36-like protein
LATINVTFTGDIASAVTLLTLVRSDTGASVSFDAAFTDAGSGTWTRTFTAPATNVTYSYTYSVTWTDGTTTPSVPGTVYVPATSYSGRYTTAALLRRRFGTRNVLAWSDTEGTGTEDTTAVQEAIDHAEDVLDAEFNGSVYAVPFTATGAALPKTVVNWATELAGYWLYTKRGLEDGDKKGDKLTAMYGRVMGEIRRYRDGWPRRTLLGVSMRTGVGSAVTIVSPRARNVSNGAALDPTTQGRGPAVRHVQGAGFIVGGG